MSGINHPKTKTFLPVIILSLGCLFFYLSLQAAPVQGHRYITPAVPLKPVVSVDIHTNNRTALYERLNLADLELSREAFLYALQGYGTLENAGNIVKSDIVTIIDFSLPSYKKRLFVVDLLQEKLLFNTYVSHGRNSGKVMAGSFSNKVNSYKSSLGFYITANTYIGKHGYSLRLRGVENGINHNAFNRSIVMHAADYATERFVKRYGYLGRSLGCPAIPPSLNKPIINTIKNGSCLFIYGTDKYYTDKSVMFGDMPGQFDS